MISHSHFVLKLHILKLTVNLTCCKYWDTSSKVINS